MNPEALHTRFANSEYGQLLESRTRFNDFKPDWVSTGMWCGLLGDDVNNLRHMPYTFNLTERFVDEQGLEGRSKERLLNTAITHDWGEAIIGDIPLPAKTEADETREEFAYRRIAKEVLGKAAGHLALQTIPVIFRKELVEADMFRGVEYVGYVATGLKAGRMAFGLAHDIIDTELTRKERQELSGSLYGLHKAIEVFNLPTLKDYRTKYLGIRVLTEEIL